MGRGVSISTSRRRSVDRAIWDNILNRKERKKHKGGGRRRVQKIVRCVGVIVRRFFDGVLGLCQVGQLIHQQGGAGVVVSGGEEHIVSQNV